MNISSTEVKVNVVAMFLKGSMKLLWRNREEDLETRCSVVNIDNCAEINVALKAQFVLGTQTWNA